MTLVAFSTTASSPTAVRLTWATVSEVNSKAFEVERSPDRVAFSKLGTLAAAGTSATPHAYAFTDVALPTGGSRVYYRLRQVNQEGTAHHSVVRPVALAGASAGPALYSNPAHGAATLAGAVPGAAVTVSDALGRPVATATADAAGTARLALPQGLAAGVYLVRTGTKALRLTVE